MNTLAMPSSETVFWLIVLGLVVVLVLGVFALIVTLLFMMRSISASIVQLREVAEVQVAQQLAADPPSADPPSAETTPADSPSAEARTAGTRTAGGETAQGDSASDGDQAAHGSPTDGATPEKGRGGTEEARNGEPGGAKN